MVGRIFGSPAGVDARRTCVPVLLPLAKRASARVRAGGRAASLDDDELIALRAVCAAVRDRGLGAEHLVLALKGVWWESTPVELLPHDRAVTELADLVSRVIETFYAARAAQSLQSLPSPMYSARQGARA